jgi:hypothetical protein
MIEFTKCYRTADGEVFGTIEEAQQHELSVVFKKHPTLQQTGLPSEPMNDWIAEMILDEKDLVIDILTTTPNSKPKARAIHGGTKKRTPKTVITDANVSATGVVNAADFSLDNH